MISAIADILKERIEDAVYIDRIAGLVSPFTYKNKKGNQVTYPVACNVTHNDCITGKVKDLIPNSNDLSVFYFEGGDAKIGKVGTKNLDGYAEINLIGWLNLKKMGKSECSITSQIISDLLIRIFKPMDNNQYFLNFLVTDIRQIEKTPSIFSPYTYNNFVNYLYYPYDYFKLQISVKYSINPNCTANSFNLEPEIEC